MNFGWRLIGGLLLCMLLHAPLSCWAENLKVWVVLSDNSAPYQSFAYALNKSLPASIQIAVLEHPEQLSQDVPQADLIVAVGTKATELASTQTSIPLLAVMIPRAGFEELLARVFPNKTTRSTSVIYLDQPWARRINFLRAALPDRRRIGLLHSPDTHFDVARLRQVVVQRGGLLVAQPVNSAEELFPKLESLLTNSDVLFAIPDNMIYSSSTIRNILLASYRHGIPLFGLSLAYVNAGALGAIFSTPEQLAAQARSAVISFARNGQLPEPQFPADFTIAVNQQVAHSLEIALPSPDAIRNQMDKAKEEP